MSVRESERKLEICKNCFFYAKKVFLAIAFPL